MSAGLDALLLAARTRTDPRAATSAGALPFASDIEALVARQKDAMVAEAKKAILPWIVGGGILTLLSIGTTVYFFTRAASRNGRTA